MCPIRAWARRTRLHYIWLVLLLFFHVMKVTGMGIDSCTLCKEKKRGVLGELSKKRDIRVAFIGIEAGERKKTFRSMFRSPSQLYLCSTSSIERKAGQARLCKRKKKLLRTCEGKIFRISNFRVIDPHTSVPSPPEHDVAWVLTPSCRYILRSRHF